MAYDLRLMMARIQQLGQIGADGADGAVATLESRLGRPLRSYEAFVAERVAAR